MLWTPMQIAMRSVAWTMQSLAALGDQYSPGAMDDVCDLARAWRPSPTPKCAGRDVFVPAAPPRLWTKVVATIAVGGAVGGLLAWWRRGARRMSPVSRDTGNRDRDKSQAP